MLQRHGVGGQRERHDRLIGGIHLAVDRRVGQAGGQEALRGVDAGLHFLLGNVDVFGQIELENDDRSALRAGGGHLVQAGHLAELPFQRSGDGGGHHVRAGAGIERDHLDDGIVHLRQRGDGQLFVGDKAREQNGHHQE